MTYNETQKQDIIVLKVPLDKDLFHFIAFVNQKGWSCYSVESANKQVLYTSDPQYKEEIIKTYDQWCSGYFKLASVRKTDNKNGLFRGGEKLLLVWSHYPLTLMIALLSVLLTLGTGFGTFTTFISHFSFTSANTLNALFCYQSTYQCILSAIFASHEYWRLISPIFLHFSLMHLVFNLVWLFYLGSRIEKKEGSFLLGMLILVVGLASNIAQGFVTPFSLFGGLSGVIYGLMGYCFIKEQLNSLCRFNILPALYPFMFIYLLIAYTGWLDVLTGGSIANMAHTSGLICGIICGFIISLLNKYSILKLKD